MIRLSAYKQELRVEFLDGEEKRSGPDKRFGPNERREAFKWFKGLLDEKDGLDPKEGMYLSFEKWTSAFTEKATRWYSDTFLK